MQLDILDKEASEVLSLIRSGKNGLSLINRLPRDVLALIPDFWGEHERDDSVVALTHVCRVWREVFTSRASLWTNFRCASAERTRVYIKRSKSAPINLWLERKGGLSNDDPFLEVAPHAVRRLKYLSLKTTPDHLGDITQHLSQRAPHLESLTIDGSCISPDINPTLATTLFGGDLSSLRELHLHSVRTQLHWRNMDNLTSFSLADVSDPTISVGQVLDFFESAPRLLEVGFSSAAPTFGAQNGRYVSLANLKELSISGSQSPSILLSHLIIPVGAKVSAKLDSYDPQINDYLPESLHNLKNLFNFTKIRLQAAHRLASVRFTGPDGEFCITSTSSLGRTAARLTHESLARVDPSKTQCLEIINTRFMSHELRQTFLSLKNLRTLVVDGSDTFSYLRGLDPSTTTNSIMCPKLEEIVFRTSDRLRVKSMADILSRRAVKGAVLRALRIISPEEALPGEEVAESFKQNSKVETVITKSVPLARIKTKKTENEGALVTILASGVEDPASGVSSDSSY